MHTNAVVSEQRRCHLRRWFLFFVLLLLLMLMVLMIVFDRMQHMIPVVVASSSQEKNRSSSSSSSQTIVQPDEPKTEYPELQKNAILVEEKEQQQQQKINETDSRMKQPIPNKLLLGNETTANTVLTLMEEQYAYRNIHEKNQRSQRFPSVEQRVKILMSSWYLPPCEQDQKRKNIAHYRRNGTLVWLQEIQLRQPPKPISNTTSSSPPPRTFLVDRIFTGKHTTTTATTPLNVAFDHVHALNRTLMQHQCSHRYCKDMAEYLFPALDRAHVDPDVHPILFQFGDGERTKIYNHTMSNTKASSSNIFIHPNLPVIKKFRRIISYSDLQHMTTTTTTTEHHKCYKDRIIPTKITTTTNDNHPNNNNNEDLHPIVWKLKTRRHYQRIHEVPKYDIPWEQKKDWAVFRGELTGGFPRGYPIQSSTPYERCQLFPRCRLVLHHAEVATAAATTTTANTTKSSSLLIVDAKLTSFSAHDSKQIPQFMLSENPNDENGGQTMINVSLFGDSKTLQEMLQYKALIMLEGNDVSSGLKWG